MEYWIHFNSFYFFNSVKITTKNHALGSESESHSVVSESLWSLDYTVYRIRWARILEGVAFPFSRVSSQPRDQTQVSHSQADCLPAEPQEKPKISEGDSLSIVQLIFPTQKSNLGLLRCRWVLYQLSYQGNPGKLNTYGNIVFKSYLNESWRKWGIAMNWEWPLQLEYSFPSW